MVASEIDAMTTTQHNIAILHAADAVNSSQVLHFETFSLKFKRKLHTRRHQNEYRTGIAVDKTRCRERKSEKERKRVEKIWKRRVHIVIVLLILKHFALSQIFIHIFRSVSTIVVLNFFFFLLCSLPCVSVRMLKTCSRTSIVEKRNFFIVVKIAGTLFSSRYAVADVSVLVCPALFDKQ